MRQNDFWPGRNPSPPQKTTPMQQKLGVVESDIAMRQGEASQRRYPPRLHVGLEHDLSQAHGGIVTTCQGQVHHTSSPTSRWASANTASDTSLSRSSWCTKRAMACSDSVSPVGALPVRMASIDAMPRSQRQRAVIRRTDLGMKLDRRDKGFAADAIE